MCADASRHRSGARQLPQPRSTRAAYGLGCGTGTVCKAAINVHFPEPIHQPVLSKSNPAPSLALWLPSEATCPHTEQGCAPEALVLSASARTSSQAWPCGVGGRQRGSMLLSAVSCSPAFLLLPLSRPRCLPIVA